MCDDVVDRMRGFTRVMDSFRQALEIQPGQTTPDGLITLVTTPCIGLSDQAPAALVNDVPVTELSTDKVWQIGAGAPGPRRRAHPRGVRGGR